MNMNKREYTQANKDWLTAKAQEEGVKSLPKGIYLYIEGWIIAMQQMCVGDKWEVYIPAEMGYGKFSQPGIPGGSTLIFEIELLSIA